MNLENVTQFSKELQIRQYINGANFCRHDFQGKVYRKARSKYRGSNPGLRLKGGGITKEFAPPPEQTSLFVEGAEIEVPGQSPHLSCIWYDLHKHKTFRFRSILMWDILCKHPYSLYW